MHLDLLKRKCECGCGGQLDLLPPKGFKYRRFINQHQNHPGPTNVRWKGGRALTHGGYVVVRSYGHPDGRKDGSILEHRLVAEKMLGRRLSREEIAHHIDGDRTNNDPANIEVVQTAEHHANRHKVKAPERREADEPNPVVRCACGCGETFHRYDHDNRPRRFVHGHNGRLGRQQAK